MLKKTLLAYTIGFAFSPPANADGIEIAAVDFDRETLKSLGVDPNISHYFSRSARFLPGEYSLIVSVNGKKKATLLRALMKMATFVLIRHFCNKPV